MKRNVPVLADQSTNKQVGIISVNSDATSTPDLVLLDGLAIPHSANHTYQNAVDIRIDQLCYQIFGSYDYIQELIEANRHIYNYIFDEKKIPAKCYIVIPNIDVAQNSINDFISKLPSWRR